ncbi:MAG: PKD domain-containing protein, partial [Thermoplasmatales archaeon]|nr:PKD domain-containing protein [Thermoplasmatales archaeon]
EDNDTIKYIFDWDDGTTDESRFLPNGTSFTINHSWTAAGRYIVTVTVTDNKTDSSTELTVYIDAITVGDIGYLIDIDGNEIYDSFHNAATGIETPVEKQDNGTYLIDVDGDGTWNYNYDPIAGTITTISEEESTTEEMQWAFIAVISIAIIIIAAIVYFYKKEYF